MISLPIHIVKSKQGNLVLFSPLTIGESTVVHGYNNKRTHRFSKMRGKHRIKRLYKIWVVKSHMSRSEKQWKRSTNKTD